MSPHPTVGTSPVNVRLPADLHQAAIDRATAEDRSLAALIRVALRQYLDA